LTEWDRLANMLLLLIEK
jgi:hypothetical protein